MDSSSTLPREVVEYMTVHERIGLEAIDAYDGRLLPRRELLPFLNRQETIYHGPRWRPRPHQLLECDGRFAHVFLPLKAMSPSLPLANLDQPSKSVIFVGSNELIYERPPPIKGWSVIRC